MVHPKFLSSAEIVKAAVHLVECREAEGLSLRAVAAALSVKAPSLYRYFPDKEALEIAVAEEILNVILNTFEAASATADQDTRYRRIGGRLFGLCAGAVPALRVRHAGRTLENSWVEGWQGCVELHSHGFQRRFWTAGRHRCCCRYLVLPAWIRDPRTLRCVWDIASETRAGARRRSLLSYLRQGRHACTERDSDASDKGTIKEALNVSNRNVHAEFRSSAQCSERRCATRRALRHFPRASATP